LGNTDLVDYIPALWTCTPAVRTKRKRYPIKITLRVQIFQTVGSGKVFAICGLMKPFLAK
jgi:hypothetical protein